MALESNGNGEYPAAQQLTIADSGRTLTGRVPHFSTLLVKTLDGFTASLTLDSRSVAVGADVVGTATVAKAASPDTAGLIQSSFDGVTVDQRTLFASQGPIGVSTNAPPPRVTFSRDVARTVTGTYGGTCLAPGLGTVVYQGELADVFIDVLTFLLNGGTGGTPSIHIHVVRDYECTAGTGAPVAVATGVFAAPLGLTGPDGLRVFHGPFANLGNGPFAVFAGAKGMVATELKTGLSVINWTPGGIGGVKLGNNLIGALPIRQPGADGIAALFGFGNLGSALTNYVRAIGTFGAANVGSAQVLDAATAGGGLDANAFMSVGARGLEFYAYDVASELYLGQGGLIVPSLFDGQVVSAAWPLESGPVLVLTRRADAGTASKVFAIQRSGGIAELRTTFGGAEARRLRCVGGSAATTTVGCVATLSGGEAKIFAHDPAAPTAALAVLSVPTAAGSLGVDVTRRANGNLLAVVANLEAQSVTLIETTPDAANLVASSSLAAPSGCTSPAHPAFLADSDGLKVIATCFASNSYWVFRF